jgi:2-oxoglutarate dehydrogenase E2 component (dihydrolipoamide succinyltransferase)
MSIELKIPEVGESIQEVQIGKWLKQEGERVELDENVVELETDKASMELPAPAAGVIKEILKGQGESVNVGETIAYLDEANGAPARRGSEEGAEQERTKAEKESKKKGKKKKGKRDREERADEGQAKEREPRGEEKRDESQQRERRSQDVHVTPSGRRALLEHGLRAEDVEASGGRIRPEDVERAVRVRKSPEGDGKASRPESPDEVKSPQKEAPRAAVEADESLEELVPMSLIRRRIAQRLVEAQQQAALLTTFNEIDMSAVMALRKEHGERFGQKYGVKLGFMSFFVKAVIDALKEFPELNAEIRGTDILYRNYFHVGIAIGGERGLVVPVLRHAERLSFAEIEQKIGDFAARARENKLTPDELSGGTFTITNGGVYGSLLSTPIVNPPQSGVLGMHAIQDRPVAEGGQVVIRPMMYVALTYDHRIVDGREAVSFLRRVREAIEEPSRMLLEV